MSHRPTKAEIRRTIQAAIEAGLDVRGVLVQPNGAIAVLDDGQAKSLSSPAEVDEWDMATGAVQ